MRPHHLRQAPPYKIGDKTPLEPCRGFDSSVKMTISLYPKAIKIRHGSERLQHATSVCSTRPSNAAKAMGEPATSPARLNRAYNPIDAKYDRNFLRNRQVLAGRPDVDHGAGRASPMHCRSRLLPDVERRVPITGGVGSSSSSSRGRMFC